MWIDKNFPLTEQKEIERAIAEWNTALNQGLAMQVASVKFDMEWSEIERCLSENGIMILSVPSYGDVMRYVDDGNIGAKTDKIGGNVIYLLNDRVNKDNIFAFTLHEMGHVLGAEHTEHGLMYPRYRSNKTYCVDKEAVEQVARYNGLDINKLNYCKQE